MNTHLRNSLSVRNGNRWDIVTLRGFSHVPTSNFWFLIPSGRKCRIGSHRWRCFSAEKLRNIVENDLCFDRTVSAQGGNVELRIN